MQFCGDTVESMVCKTNSSLWLAAMCCVHGTHAED